MSNNHNLLLNEFPSLVVNNLRDNNRMEGVHQMMTRDELRDLLRSTLENEFNERSSGRRNQEQTSVPSSHELPSSDDTGYGL